MKNQTTTTIFTVIIIALVAVLAFGLIGGIFGKEEEVDSTPGTSRPAVTEPATEETEEATEPAREITFTLMNESCTALEGMTWGEWVDTDYNIGGHYDCKFAVVSSDGEHIESNIVYGGLPIVLDGNYISPDDLIIENGVYAAEEP